MAPNIAQAPGYIRFKHPAIGRKLYTPKIPIQHGRADRLSRLSFKRARDAVVWRERVCARWWSIFGEVESGCLT